MTVSIFFPQTFSMFCVLLSSDKETTPIIDFSSLVIHFYCGKKMNGKIRKRFEALVHLNLSGAEVASLAQTPVQHTFQWIAFLVLGFMANNNLNDQQLRIPHTGSAPKPPASSFPCKINKHKIDVCVSVNII